MCGQVAKDVYPEVRALRTAKCRDKTSNLLWKDCSSRDLKVIRAQVAAAHLTVSCPKSVIQRLVSSRRAALPAGDHCNRRVMV